MGGYRRNPGIIEIYCKKRVSLITQRKRDLLLNQIKNERRVFLDLGLLRSSLAPFSPQV
jgi:hypothetical protein